MAESGQAKPKTNVLDQLGGPVGLAYTGIPIVVFVAINGFFGLTPAVIGAVGAGVAIMLLRLLRKESVQPAVSGLFGVGVAAFVAYQTGSAKNFFLIGIWASVLAGSVLLISILVRRPLVGVLVNNVAGKGDAWRRDKPSLRGYDLATFALLLVFAARFVVWQWLYVEDSVGWLAAARLAMGYPLLGLALLVTLWAVRRSTKRLKTITGPRPA